VTAASNLYLLAGIAANVRQMASASSAAVLWQMQPHAVSAKRLIPLHGIHPWHRGQAAA
jgi:hypothetical protein